MTAVAGHEISASGEASPLITSKRLWWLVLLVGAAVWLLAALITGLTGDTILVPTVILLGSFLAPVSLVLFALSRSREGFLTADVVLLGFLCGGTLGLVFAALTEVYFLPSEYGTFLTVGLIEESAKGLVLVAVAYRVRPRGALDGMALGATVGAGFAAFESSGYALKSLIVHASDHPVLNIVESEISRAVLSPFGHITWTALLGGALFAASRNGAFRLTTGVLWTFVGIILLHAAWDASFGWSIAAAQGLVADDWTSAWPKTDDWIGTPTNEELTVQTVVYHLLIGLNALIGTTWIVRRWRRYRRARGAA